MPLDSSLPPMQDIPDMFLDMTNRAMALGLDEALKIFKGRSINIATMCSGTESPIFALKLVGDALDSMGFNFTYEHVFSAEITPFKQAFIQRNFMPPLLFRDVSQIRRGKQAETAYAATAVPPVPGVVQFLVAGFACVDFSNLNRQKRTFEFDETGEARAPGESGATFSAIYTYAREHRPSIVILENIVGAKWNLVAKQWELIEYAACHVLLDSKKYYLPQTRTRGYMICINHEASSSKLSQKEAEEGAQKWIEIVKQLQRPASSPIEDFLLPVTSPLLQKALKQINPKSVGFQDRSLYEWGLCKERHRSYRSEHAVGSGTPFTQWRSGRLLIPAYVCKPWASIQPDRILDTLDIIKLTNAKRGRDIEYKANVVDLSQNVDRDLDVVHTGLTGCITPTGIPYSTLRGRPIVGIEALSLQGLPINRIHLTAESQKDLQDLAGNAMTTTVVGAALLAAFAAVPQAISFVNTNTKATSQPLIEDMMQAITPSGVHSTISLINGCDFGPLKTLRTLEILELATRTFEYCPCEGPYKTSSSTVILECQKCFATVCASCAGNPVHSLRPMNFLKDRLPPSKFVETMFEVLPTRVSVNINPRKFLEAMEQQDCNADVEFLDALKRSLGQEARLRSINRGARWTVIYDSMHLHLELIIESLSAKWLLFVRSPAHLSADHPARRLLNHPVARLQLDRESNHIHDGVWEICVPKIQEAIVDVAGCGELVPSWRNSLEIPSYRDEMVWSELKLEVASELPLGHQFDIEGTFELLHSCGTPNRGLHRRVSASRNSVGPMYLFYNPSLYDHEDDAMVITEDIRRLNPGDYRVIHGHFGTLDNEKTTEIGKRGKRKYSGSSPSWQPSSTVCEKIKYQSFGKWLKCDASLKVLGPTEGIQEISLFGQAENLPTEREHQCSDMAINILSSTFRWIDRNPIGSLQKGRWEIAEDNESLLAVDLQWLMKRINLFGAQNQSPWTSVPVMSCQDICAGCAPSPPDIRWKMGQKCGTKGTQKGMVPYEDVSQAGPFERAWKARPSPILLRISVGTFEQDEMPFGTIQASINVESLIHRAIARFPHRTSLDFLKAFWRLSTNVDENRIPVLNKYILQSNKNDPATHFVFEGGYAADGSELVLRVEQSRSLQWMIHRDKRLTSCYDEQVIEECSSEILKWRLEARVTRQRRIRGGILADQVGYGKTVLIIALIRITMHSVAIETGEANSLAESPCYPIPVKATCIMVPSTLIPQWQNEILRFWPGCLLIVIKTPADLANCSISEVKTAEIILISTSLLLHTRYKKRLAELSGLPEPSKQQRPREWEAWLKTSRKRLRVHIIKLLKQGPSGFAEYLGSQYQHYSGDWTAYNKVASKRYRGSAFQKQQRSKEWPQANQGSETPLCDQSRFIEGFDTADCRNVTGIVLNMFRFHRKVVDEQTYVSAQEMKAISAIDSCSNWILSATPAMSDFTDIQRLAGFLGVFLGVEDSSPSVTAPWNVAAMRREWTTAERFHAYQVSHSAEWHENRQMTAQSFLDKFARRNEVEHAKVPMVEHYCPIRLDHCHQLVNAESQALILSRGIDPPKTGSLYGGSSDRLYRLKLILGSSSSRHEALIQSACYDPCLMVKQPNEGDDRQLMLLSSREEMEEMVDGVLRESLYALKNYEESFPPDGHQKWKAISTVAQDGGFGVCDTSVETLERFNSKVEYQTLLPFLEKALEENKFSTEKTAATVLQAFIRKCCSKVHDHVHALIDSSRAALLFRNALCIQTLSSQEHRTPFFTSDCGCLIEDISDLLLNACCGHVTCDSCMSGRDVCGVDGCDAGVTAIAMLTYDELFSFNRRPPAKYCGRKIDEIINLIRNVDQNDQVIIFSQFDGITLVIAQALARDGIHHYRVKESNNSERQVKRAQDEIEAFRTQALTGRHGEFAKVLILNPADASSAGHNLTNASTVIFVAPLVTYSDELFHASYTQAIGRVRRLGQEKVVHVYHFLVLRTLEVNMLERRYGKELRIVDRAGASIPEGYKQGKKLRSRPYRLSGLSNDD